LGERQHRFNRWAWVTLLDRTGKVLLAPNGQRVKLAVIADNTDQGWKISPSKFLFGVLASRQGMEGRKERYAALCEGYGVLPEFYWPEKRNGSRFSSSTDGVWPGVPKGSWRCIGHKQPILRLVCSETNLYVRHKSPFAVWRTAPFRRTCGGEVPVPVTAAERAEMVNTSHKFRRFQGDGDR
jgi:hypothetical protein